MMNNQMSNAEAGGAAEGKTEVRASSVQKKKYDSRTVNKFVT
jgi:hypothetical protein